MNEERTWTGNSEVDAAIVMLDRIDCSPKNNSRIDAVETTLRRLHARNQELEARLQKLQSDYDAVGAGGVSAQRVTQGKDHIEQPVEMVAAQEPFGYFKAEPFGWRDCADTDEGAIALYEAPQPQADGRDAQRYRWLIDYFISDRVDLDDAIVAAKTPEDIAKIIDAAIAAAKGAPQPQADALDTERLDWLIEQGCHHGVVYELDKSFWMVWLDGHDARKDEHQIGRYHTAREAIDAAIAAAKENK